MECILYFILSLNVASPLIGAKIVIGISSSKFRKYSESAKRFSDGDIMSASNRRGIFLAAFELRQAEPLFLLLTRKFVGKPISKIPYFPDYWPKISFVRVHVLTRLIKPYWVV